MVNKLIRWAVTMLMVAALCFAFYEAGQEVGRSEARVQVIEKQVEVIRYVEKKKPPEPPCRINSVCPQTARNKKIWNYWQKA
jgi:hypothetical protein